MRSLWHARRCAEGDRSRRTSFASELRVVSILTKYGGHLNADEHYKYVDPNEVYPLGNYLFVNETDADSDFELPILPPGGMNIPTINSPGTNWLSDPVDNPHNMMQSMPENDRTNINFNPVIKVITDGNDNSQGVDPINSQTPQIHVTPSATIEQPQDYDIPQEPTNINFNEPIIVKKQ